MASVEMRHHGRSGAAACGWKLAGGLVLQEARVIEDTIVGWVENIWVVGWKFGFFLEFGYRGSKPELPIIISGIGTCYPK